MTTYPSSSLSPAPALTDEATLEVALDCLLKHVPLDMEGSSCTDEDLFEIPLRAASRHDSIEHTAQRLEGVLSGNGIRYHLDQLDDMVALERRLNARSLNPHALPSFLSKLCLSCQSNGSACCNQLTEPL